ncbi:hypothetical protein QO034_05135 [Sedimentitalea sp. JM2-8]|uniref:EF-hand domain-containing protein n=1 Tax=Sedimentitalea xiamensis TaxID=3050037 RepID=A0ABT7FBJ7_9RHOB|nr:hypothetical protein [Sedimentitalea xiamensis]MDK3072490.1 hypothetical protein [Sedimentitalea xiamensis]
MLPKTLTFLSSIGLALPALAMAATELDTNGDGLLTLDEVQVVLPDTTAESFTAMDANSDGALDVEEVGMAQDAGLLPKG